MDQRSKKELKLYKTLRRKKKKKENLYDFILGKGFLKMTPKHGQQKEKKNR